ncbi:enoyl-CoA hydratase [Oleiphilus messinensis]|uniref:Enoyl-CoA hydratase n=1 Tax=Oleiphilus messinensis TaxID=141451 RepID=A0A1Y0IA31_9GAMM|nr:crotonase/enoyl-CoA hydratase family protein [Oleiphilus messinensis]ARU56253.1 enoyl-CoA hydratase [Oleiphilus messinensis]
MSRVLLEIIDNHIAVVSMNRPEKYNGLDIDMFTGLVDTAKQIQKNKSVKVVILKGNGKVFSSGLDVKNVTSSPTAVARLLFKPGRKASNLAQDVALVWRNLPVPVIAVTHGVCFGGALQIALGADFRYATPDCEFSIMEGKWGLIPDMSGTITLRELLPIDVVKELTMTAKVISAPEAKSLGLITRISDDPFAEALSFAHTLLEKSSDAVNGAKLLFNKTWLASEREALRIETQIQTRLIRKKFFNLKQLKALL